MSRSPQGRLSLSLLECIEVATPLRLDSPRKMRSDQTTELLPGEPSGIKKGSGRVARPFFRPKTLTPNKPNNNSKRDKNLLLYEKVTGSDPYTVVRRSFVTAINWFIIMLLHLIVWSTFTTPCVSLATLVPEMW